MANLNKNAKSEKAPKERKARDPNAPRCPTCGRIMPVLKSYTAEEITEMEQKALSAQEKIAALMAKIERVKAGPVAAPAPAPVAAPVAAPARGSSPFRK